MLAINKFFEKHTINLFSIFWLFYFSFILVVQYAPPYLDADVILNSVMSLQKLTLYYWGQNRLLNIVPALVCFLKNPTLNLYAILFLHSWFFSALIFSFSYAAARMTDHSTAKELTLNTFVVVSALCFIFFTPRTLYIMTIAHVEYTLSGLLFFISVYSALCYKSIKAHVFIGIALFVAIGLNPSTVIPCFFFAVFSLLYKKKFFKRSEWAIMLTSFISFVAWMKISLHYGSKTYSKFYFNDVEKLLKRVLISAVDIFQWSAILVSVSLICLCYILKEHYSIRVTDKQNNQDENLSSYIEYGLFLFSMLWILLFSCNHWIKINNEAWRYFTNVIFCLIFYVTIKTAELIHVLKQPIVEQIIHPIVFLVVWFYHALLPEFSDYNIFKKVNSLTDSGGVLYAGNYWSVWPSVYRDMMQGYPAYGFDNGSMRGFTNRKAAQKYVQETLQKNGSVSILCLEEKPEYCLYYIKLSIGPIRVKNISLVKNNVYKIELVQSQSTQASP